MWLQPPQPIDARAMDRPQDADRVSRSGAERMAPQPYGSPRLPLRSPPPVPPCPPCPPWCLAHGRDAAPWPADQRLAPVSLARCTSLTRVPTPQGLLHATAATVSPEVEGVAQQGRCRYAPVNPASRPSAISQGHGLLRLRQPPRRHGRRNVAARIGLGWVGLAWGGSRLGTQTRAGSGKQTPVPGPANDDHSDGQRQ